jgi:hypothetical protein
MQDLIKLLQEAMIKERPADTVQESALKKYVAEFKRYKGKISESEGWEKDKDNLYQHALQELKIAGLFDADSDYGGMLGKAIMDVVEAFCKQGHSGGSASIVLQIMPKILAWENLTPITDDPAYWMNVQEQYGEDGAGHGMKGVWQCRRNPALFSNDGGKTYYHVDKQDEIMRSEAMRKEKE